MLVMGYTLLEMGESLREKVDPIKLEEIRGLRRDDVNAFDRTATSNWSYAWGERSDEYRDTLLGATLLMMCAEALQVRLSDTAAVVTMFGELYLIVKGTTYLTKAIVGRKRPYVYNTAMSEEERYNIARNDENDVFFSFFSGHTAAAFAAATFTSKVVTDIHGKSVWSSLLWGSSLSLAALTGYARVKCCVHYPSDVIVGAVVGGAIGYLVPELHKKNARHRLSLVPAYDRMGLQLHIDLSRRLRRLPDDPPNTRSRADQARMNDHAVPIIRENTR